MRWKATADAHFDSGFAPIVYIYPRPAILAPYPHNLRIREKLGPVLPVRALAARELNESHEGRRRGFALGELAGVMLDVERRHPGTCSAEPREVV